jgi:hypothetical protein
MKIKAVLILSKYSLLATLRSPTSVVFSLLFPIIFIVVFGSMIGDQTPAMKLAIGPGCDTANLLFKAIGQIPSITFKRGMSETEQSEALEKGRITAGVFGSSFLLFSLRQSLVLKRLRATPVRRRTIIAGKMLSRLFFHVIGFMIMVALGYFAFGFTLVNGLFTFIEMLIFSFFGLGIFMGIGFVISGMIHNESSISPVANTIVLPQILLYYDNSFNNEILIRYAEVLLTYAEAKIESNQIDQSVYDAINQVRQRTGVGQPAATAVTYPDQASLRTLLRRERHVEFAVEPQRLFDIRRWQTAAAVMPGNVLGVLNNFDPTRSDYGQHVQVEVRAFNPARDYLWAIPENEILLNKNLSQNPNW